MRKHRLIILNIMLLSSLLMKAQMFRFYDTNKGLSSSQITQIMQDHQGYIWIATEDGLNQFDGIRFTAYRNIPGDPNSIMDNQVRQVCEDSKHRLWVATSSGLCLLDVATKKFVPFRIHTKNSKTEYLQFYHLIEDTKGDLWTAVSGEGVLHVNTTTGEAHNFNTANSGICSNHINVLFEDRFGNIWIGSYSEGISIYNPTNGTFRNYKQEDGQEDGLSSNLITGITEGCDGNIWVSTSTGGVNVFSWKSGTFSSLDLFGQKCSCLRMDKLGNMWIGTIGKGFGVYSGIKRGEIQKNINTMSVDVYSSTVTDIFEDRQGNIWLALYQKGLLMLAGGKNRFNKYAYNPYSKSLTIREGAVQPLFVDSHSDIWLGVDGAGLYRLDKDFSILNQYKEQSGYSFVDAIPISVFEDSKQNVWIGTYLNGIIRYNRSANKFDKQLSKRELTSSIVTDITEDDKERLWIATNNGVQVLNLKSNELTHIQRDNYKCDNNQLIDNRCVVVFIDKAKKCWIGTYGGLSLYDPANSTQFENFSIGNKMLPNNMVQCLKEDNNGDMWVGTLNGLARISSDRKKVKFYNLNEGLPNSSIVNLETDMDGSLWVCTKNGISKYDAARDVFINYSTEDGMPTNEIMKNAISKTAEGCLLVGTTNGFFSFNPKWMDNSNENPLKLIFSNLYIYSEPILPDSSKNAILHQSLDYVEKLTLNHQQNNFSIEVVALEYQYPEKVHYEAMLEGLDKQWNVVRNRTISYTNLNSGSYTLVVKAWTNDEDHALIKKITIQVLAPWWATWWAKMTYCLLAALFCYFIFRAIKEKLTVKRNELIMQEKLQFFTDISHEIRTPLTLILSPLSKLMKKKEIDNGTLSTYSIMYKNGQYLLRLVNQIMDLRALEFNKKRLTLTEVDIVDFVREIKESFDELAADKTLQYTFNTTLEQKTGCLDTDLVGKIIQNLISNAFKYTNEGTIDITLKIGKNEAGIESLTLAVADTGIGISREQQKMIFERFYKVPGKQQYQQNSAGIGLHLTKRLVELHKGTIGLISNINKGSVFSFTIPISRVFYENEGYVISKEQNCLLTSPLHIKDVKLLCSEHRNNRYTMLIVEDNEDIKQMLAQEFGDYFKILLASNGLEGLKIAVEAEPSIIITDIIMPEMNGIEMCDKIRKNGFICHVPIIMLTACSSMMQQIEGLKHGADVYISKPFDLNYLHASVTRLITSRDELRRKYNSQLGQSESECKELNVESSDQKLLKNLNELIEKHISNTELNVDVLCVELGVSRTQINRKIKELTGESPALYIRQIRLHRSVLLLKKSEFSISEIAYMVGFSSPSYFAQAFKDYFGKSPKEYAQ